MIELTDIVAHKRINLFESAHLMLQLGHFAGRRLARCIARLALLPNLHEFLRTREIRALSDALTPA